jgi:hypothetical protein
MMLNGKRSRDADMQHHRWGWDWCSEDGKQQQVCVGLRMLTQEHANTQ